MREVAICRYPIEEDNDPPTLEEVRKVFPQALPADQEFPDNGMFLIDLPPDFLQGRVNDLWVEA